MEKLKIYESDEKIAKREIKFFNKNNLIYLFLLLVLLVILYFEK